MNEQERANASMNSKERTRGLFSFIGVGVFCMVGFWLADGPEMSVVSAVILGVMVFFYQRRTKELQGEAFRKLDGAEVEVLHVETSRVVSLLRNHRSRHLVPVLLIDGGDGKVLVLCGMWLEDASIWSDDAEEDESEVTSFNGLRAPHAFPCTRFTLARLPRTGEVLSISNDGEYLEPDGTDASLASDDEPQQSMVINGSVDDVKGVLTRFSRASR